MSEQQKKPRFFDHYYKKWLKREITQSEASKKLGISQSFFSKLALKESAEDTIENRRPDNFDTVVESYRKGDIGLRAAGERLGVSHTTVSNWLKALDSEEHNHSSTSNTPMSLSDKVHEVSQSYEKLNENRNSNSRDNPDLNIDL